MLYEVITEGMSDHPRQELGGKTPLQVASTPHLDRLARCSEMGLLTVALDVITSYSIHYTKLYDMYRHALMQVLSVYLIECL